VDAKYAIIDTVSLIIVNMTLSVGRRIFMKLYGNSFSSLSLRITAVRFSSASAKENGECTKIIIPAPQPDKIQAAVLKEFGNPLVIENLEPPKRVQSNEVNIKSRLKSEINLSMDNN